MANVVSVLTTDTGGDVSRRVFHTVTVEDNNNIQTTYPPIVMITDDSYDAVAGAIKAGDSFLLDLENAEKIKHMNMDEDVTVDLNLILNPKFSTNKKIAKMLIRWMLRERDPRIVLFLEPLIVYIQTNFNANQVANFLDITIAQVLKINRRVNAILTDTDNFKNLIERFDTEQENIE